MNRARLVLRKELCWKVGELYQVDPDSPGSSSSSTTICPVTNTYSTYIVISLYLILIVLK